VELRILKADSQNKSSILAAEIEELERHTSSGAFEKPICHV